MQTVLINLHMVGFIPSWSMEQRIPWAKKSSRTFPWKNNLSQCSISGTTTGMSKRKLIQRTHSCNPSRTPSGVLVEISRGLYHRNYLRFFSISVHHHHSSLRLFCSQVLTRSTVNRLVSLLPLDDPLHKVRSFLLWFSCHLQPQFARHWDLEFSLNRHGR